MICTIARISCTLDSDIGVATALGRLTRTQQDRLTNDCIEKRVAAANKNLPPNEKIHPKSQAQIDYERALQHLYTGNRRMPSSQY
jgi:hypothetical protein